MVCENKPSRKKNGSSTLLSGGLRVENGESLHFGDWFELSRQIKPFCQCIWTKSRQSHKRDNQNVRPQSKKGGQMGEVTIPISLDFVRVSAPQASTSNPCEKVATLERVVMCDMSMRKTAVWGIAS